MSRILTLSVILALLNHSSNLENLPFLVGKRELLGQHGVHNDAEAPHVALLIVCASLYSNFRGKVLQCPKISFDAAVGVKFLGQSEIDQFDLLVQLVYQQILQFEVSMAYVLFMTGCDSFNYFMHDKGYETFADAGSFGNTFN
jgi:hypothetical protein